MKNKRLNLLILSIVCSCCIWLVGCGKDKDTNVSNASSDDIVLTVNETSLTLAEARYYAYNKQANYEVYYLASGSNINWNEIYYSDSDITLEQLVKAEVVEQMKKDILVCEYAQNEGISLSDEDMDEINAMADEFISDSKKELLDKVDASKDTLVKIYTRQMYCTKLYEKLQIADNTDAQNELFKMLLPDADVTLDSKLWSNINFDKVIYKSDDVDIMSE